MLAPELEQRARRRTSSRYLGIVCLVARVRSSVSPYYALNITDRRVPLTSVVETTHVVDPEQVGGHLVYVPRYVHPDSPGARAVLGRDHARVPRARAARCSRPSARTT